MDDDQQFCLRWNNHQSTLVSVFDNLLENGTLVDCTLFAEGKFLKAHKVVLSACSPYFESLLTQQYDKHPIFILKDVKFQELKAMMDYMYRGEVNISQDQLAALLKAAESLQIKGLSDSRSKGESEQRKSAPPPPAKTPPPAPTIPRVQGLTIEQRKTPKLTAASDVIEDSRSREGSTSPVPRKRKKPRRRSSQEGLNDNHDASSSSESHSNQATPAQNIPATLPAVPLASTSKITLTDVPEPIETKPEPIVTRQIKSSSLPPSTVSETLPQVPIKEKLETHSELILEPKSEYIEEEMNEDSVEDLTLDDDDVSQMEQDMDHARPGPSHGSTDNSQGFGGWHMSGNQNQDEVFLAAQEAVGAHRDSQEGDVETMEEEVVITTEMDPEQEIARKHRIVDLPVVKPSGSKIKIIRVEDVHHDTEIVGELKKELSTHLTFDNVKAINKKIINRELSLKKVVSTSSKQPATFVLRSPEKTVKKYYRRQSITASRMQKFLSMTAADCKDAQVKQPTCLAPVLKTPRDTLRCVRCDVLFDPTKKDEHLKVCRNTKVSVKSYGCMFCNFKSSSHEETANHVKNNHK